MDKNIITEKKKALFQYCCICLLSVLSGILIAGMLSKGALLDMGEQIKRHFLSPFSQNAPLYNFTYSVLCYSLVDVICISVAFLFTFSVFNYIASNVILIYQGFVIGLSTSVLLRYSVLFGSISYFYIIWFIILKISILIFFVFYLCILTKYSFDLKSYSANLRARLDPRVLLLLLAFMISASGFVILLNAIYCIGIIII